MSSLAQRKAEEMLGLLRTKKTEELTGMRDNYRARLKQERSKQTPDEATLGNINYHLSLIGRVIGERRPIEVKDEFEQAQGALGELKPKSDEQKLSEKSLDELGKMLIDAEAGMKKFEDGIMDEKLAPAELKAKFDLLNSRIITLKTEIASRETPKPTVSGEARKEVAKIEGKKIIGVDSAYVMSGAVGVLALGAFGYGLNRGKAYTIGGALIGLGLGVGIGHLIKSSGDKKVAQKI